MRTTTEKETTKNDFNFVFSGKNNSQQHQKGKKAIGQFTLGGVDTAQAEAMKRRRAQRFESHLKTKPKVVIIIG